MPGFLRLLLRPVEYRLLRRSQAGPNPRATCVPAPAARGLFSLTPGCSALAPVCKPPSLAKMPFSTAKHEYGPFLKPIYIGSLPFTCPCGGVLGEKFHPSLSPNAIRKALLFPSRTFPRGEEEMFQAFALLFRESFPSRMGRPQKGPERGRRWIPGDPRINPARRGGGREASRGWKSMRRG